MQSRPAMLNPAFDARRKKFRLTWTARSRREISQLVFDEKTDDCVTGDRFRVLVDEPLNDVIHAELIIERALQFALEIAGFDHLPIPFALAKRLLY